MPSTTSAARTPAPVGALVEILLLAAATAASWFVWFGWDHEYQTDPVTGVASGPYETWQGVGCVLTLAVIGVLAAVRVNPVAAAVTMTVAFTAAWCATEMPGDSTGLAGVGAVMVLLGMGLGTAVWFGVAAAVGSRQRR
jgi:hypothetical protein